MNRSRFAQGLLLLALAGCTTVGSVMGEDPAQVLAQRFKAMPAQDDVIASADWYRPRVRVAGAQVDAIASNDVDARARFGAALEVSRSYDSLAVVVMVDGRVVLEDYAPGFDARSRFDSQSMHRGLLALAVLAAVEDGAIRSLAQPLADFLPEWRSAQDARGRITLLDLMRNQSGFVDPPYEFRADSPGMQLFIGTDLRGLVLAQHPVAAAGQAYRGTALDAQLLGLVLERATGMPYAQFLSQRLWSRIGAQDAWVRLDRDHGSTRTFCCLQASARDWARVGELVRRGGLAGDARVLNEGSITQLLTPSPIHPTTGMSWFLEPTALVPRSVSGDRPVPTPTAFDATGVVYAGGRGGQRVYVLPQQRAVVVRIGRIRNDFDDGRFLNPFIAALAPRASSGTGSAQGLTVRIPEKPFGELPHPPAPNYADAAYWAALPDRRDAADVVPANDPFGDRQQRAAVDVFYIHPTTYRDTTHWNQPLSDVATNDWTDESVIARQAAVFNACCRVYAPRYRQATAAAVYATPDKKPLAAYEFAWGDVRAAFLHYMQHWNHGRPYIIVGHSQGAAHVERWLNEFGAQKKYRSLLVAAYPIGVSFSEGQLSTLGGGIHVCATPTAVDCLVTWNTFDRAGDPSAYIRQSQSRFAQRFGKTDGAEIICVNPLTFDLAQPGAHAAANLGALPARRGVGLAASLAAGIQLPALEVGRLGAACEDGVLRVDSPPKEGYAVVPLPAGMLHFNDFDLFYANIRANAVLRADAFMRAKAR